MVIKHLVLWSFPNPCLLIKFRHWPVTHFSLTSATYCSGKNVQGKRSNKFQLTFNYRLKSSAHSIPHLASLKVRKASAEPRETPSFPWTSLWLLQPILKQFLDSRNCISHNQERLPKLNRRLFFLLYKNAKITKHGIYYLPQRDILPLKFALILLRVP